MVKIGNLKAQLDRCWIVRNSLEIELNRTGLTLEERAEFLVECDRARKESDVIQLVVDLLGRQEREEHTRRKSPASHQ
jgi:hypothetical protein